MNKPNLPGISLKERDIIENILKAYPYEFYYYGSRVKGDYTKASDLDILVKSETKIPEKILEELSLEFNKSLLPYVVNISEYLLLKPDFYKLIEPSLIKVEISR